MDERRGDNMSKVTVQDLIDSLKRYPMDATVEIAVTQYNKSHPVAYVEPHKHVFGVDFDKQMYATMKNGEHVRIEIRLPCDGDSYMVTKIIKKK